jgi:hypothetical protein
MKNAVKSPVALLLIPLLLASLAIKAGIAQGQGQHSPPSGQRLVVFEIFGRCG